MTKPITISFQQFGPSASYADSDQSGTLEGSEVKVVERDFKALDTNGNKLIDDGDSFSSGNAAAAARLMQTGVEARREDPEYAQHAFDLTIMCSQNARANQDLQSDAYYNIGVMYVESNNPEAAANAFKVSADLLEKIGETGTEYQIAKAQHHKLQNYVVTKEYAPLVQKLSSGLSVGEKCRLGALLSESLGHLNQLERLLNNSEVADELGMQSHEAATGRAAAEQLTQYIDVPASSSACAGPAPDDEGDALLKELLRLQGRS